MPSPAKKVSSSPSKKATKSGGGAAGKGKHGGKKKSKKSKAIDEPSLVIDLGTLKKSTIEETIRHEVEATLEHIVSTPNCGGATLAVATETSSSKGKKGKSAAKKLKAAASLVSLADVTRSSFASIGGADSVPSLNSTRGGRHSTSCRGEKLEWLDVESRSPEMVRTNLPCSAKSVPNEATLTRCWYSIRTHFELKPLDKVLEDLEIAHAAPRPRSEGGGGGSSSAAEDALHDRNLHLSPALLVREFLTARGEHFASGDGNERTWAALETMISDHLIAPRARPLPSFGQYPPINASHTEATEDGSARGATAVSVNSHSLVEEEASGWGTEWGRMKTSHQVLWPKPPTRATALSLHVACSQGALTRCKEAARVYQDAINCPDDRGDFPLHIVAASGHVEIAYTLLQAGAMVDVPDCLGNTALHVAASTGCAQLAVLLMDAGAKLVAENCYGETPLHRACRHNAKEVVQALLARQAPVGPATRAGFTPLHYAAAARLGPAGEMTKLLLEAGADKFAVTVFGHTPLERAAMVQSHDSVAALASWDPASSGKKKKLGGAGGKAKGAKKAGKR